MAKKNFAQKERIALKEDILYRGYIHSVLNPYTPGDSVMYNVQWDKHGCHLYLGEALISEAEADEIQAKRDAETKANAEVAGIAAKFKAMEKEAEVK